jgi:hypothetical protein
MTGYVCRRRLSGRSKSPSPHRAQPNPRTPRKATALNFPSHTRSRPPNLHARQKPIPIGQPSWLSPRGCIGNAPAIRLFLPSPPLSGRRTPDTTHMTSHHQTPEKWASRTLAPNGHLGNSHFRRLPAARPVPKNRPATPEVGTLRSPPSVSPIPARIWPRSQFAVGNRCVAR